MPWTLSVAIHGVTGGRPRNLHLLGFVCVLSGTSCHFYPAVPHAAKTAAAAPSAPTLEPAPSTRHVEGDGDGDGVADADDLCPTQAEDRDDCDDEDGCSDPDDDHDGTLDADDQCRFKPGPRDNHGCPVPVEPGKIYVESISCPVLQPVLFEKNVAKLDAQAQEIVKAVSSCFATESTLLLLEMRGHQAEREASSGLALQRAHAVTAALVAHGVDPKRLRATVGDSAKLRQPQLGEQVVHFVVLRTLSCPAN
jgi:OmpA-OmpF porin, OOP family